VKRFSRGQELFDGYLPGAGNTVQRCRNAANKFFNKACIGGFIAFQVEAGAFSPAINIYGVPGNPEYKKTGRLGTGCYIAVCQLYRKKDGTIFYNHIFSNTQLAWFHTIFFLGWLIGPKAALRPFDKLRVTLLRAAELRVTLVDDEPGYRVYIKKEAVVETTTS